MPGRRSHTGLAVRQFPATDRHHDVAADVADRRVFRLLIAGSTLNIFSAIGFIMLMGLVTKNAILLVDFFNQSRARGTTVDETLLEAGSIRLRPILMTTLAMVFGMMPLALGVGERASQRAPMAHAVIGGLISSTLLTLIVVPVVLVYIDRLGAWAALRFSCSADEMAGRHKPAE